MRDLSVKTEPDATRSPNCPWLPTTIQVTRLHRVRLKRVTLNLKCVPELEIADPWCGRPLQNSSNAKSLGEQILDQSLACERLRARDR
jgi:hypothetical protein